MSTVKDFIGFERQTPKELKRELRETSVRALLYRLANIATNYTAPERSLLIFYSTLVNKKGRFEIKLTGPGSIHARTGYSEATAKRANARFRAEGLLETPPVHAGKANPETPFNFRRDMVIDAIVKLSLGSV